MSGGGGTSPTPTLNAKEKTAQLFTDYYEGEVNVKPSDIRYKGAQYRDNQSETFNVLCPIQFEQSPFPVIVVKNNGNIQSLSPTSKSPYPVGTIVPLINGEQIVTLEDFENEQQLSNFGYLLVGYVDADSSLLGILPHPADE